MAESPLKVAKAEAGSVPSVPSPAASSSASASSGSEDLSCEFIPPEDVDEIPGWLGRRALMVEDWFACGGEKPVQEALRVTFTDDSVADFSEPLNVMNKKGEVQRTELYETLMKLAEVSPFGHGKETKVDSSVRRAYHIPGAKIRGIEGLQLQEIVDEVRTTLYPEPGQIDAELLKLNIYEEGGHFVNHRDTPRYADAVCSLVVCLPTAHHGGSLVVQHQGEEVTFAFDQALCPGQEGNKVSKGSYELGVGAVSADVACGRPVQCTPYAAFFGHVLHKVRRVKAGTRVTLAYVLRRASNHRQLRSTDVTSDHPPQSDIFHPYLQLDDLKKRCREAGLRVSGSKAALRERLYEDECRKRPLQLIDHRWCTLSAKYFGYALRDALARPDFLPDGGSLGFPCMHLYERRDDIPGELRRPMRFEDVALRGMDAVVAACVPVPVSRYKCVQCCG
jgi:hypothetical protein